MTDYVTWLIIPAIALTMAVGFVPIVNGAYDTAGLGDGIARLDGMTWGRFDTGRAVIVGHGDAAFSELHTLQVGDEIGLLAGPNGVIKLQVIDVYWTVASDTRILTTPTDGYELALIACSANESHRLIVRARLVNE